MSIAVAVGMASEANLVGMRPGIVVCVGAGNALALASRLDAAIAAGADRVISVGVAGALSPDLQPGDVMVGASACDGSSVLPCDTAWAGRLWASLTGALDRPKFPVARAKFAWSNTIVVSAAAKAEMRAATGAEVVDQESWVAARVARLHGLPFAILRAVSDPALFDLPPAALQALTAAGGVDISAVFDSLGGDLAQLPALSALADYSALAFNNLAMVLALVGDDFSSGEPPP